MCREVFQILDKNLTGSTCKVEGRDDEYFLREVISPIYRVVLKEAKRSNNGKASHSNWRNYDDLNEYFWSNKCFNLGWPLNVKADFFRDPDETQTVHRVCIYFLSLFFYILSFCYIIFNYQILLC
ncbi:hypothetical protein Fmac_026894 [Flemingia macrophylla]|uniref:1,3-beta-glucan synthase component FKS1-like domain-containing protein n=1 Tax=Flemingia macrophylla TaxID=520843 RepID=A0ABD1LG57_9FABA